MPGSVSHAKRHTISSGNDHVGRILKTQGELATCYEDEANAWSVAQNLPTGSQINSELIASEAFVEAAIQSAFIVQSITVTDPSTLTPSTGEMWVVAVGSIGVWAGHDNETAEWNGTGWDYLVPTEGWRVWILDKDTSYTFNGTNWVPTGSTVTHGNLIGLANDDHPGHPWLNGRTGGQTLIGGTAGLEVLSLNGDSNNNGSIEIGHDGDDPLLVIDEAITEVRIGAAAEALNVDGSNIIGGRIGGSAFEILGDINNDGVINIGNNGLGPLIEVDESASTVKVTGNPISGILTGAGNPHTTVTGSIGQIYRDTINNIWYICISNPNGTNWEVL